MGSSSKTPSTSADEPNRTVDERSRKGKVPKRINKSVRERLKREHLNDLFIELADTLELNQQNSGKASILSEATRFLKDVFAQIESLRKDHTSLLSESNYVTTEKNELKEETSVLETEILQLQAQIEARVTDLNTSPAPDFHHHPDFQGLPVFQAATPLVVLPIQQDIMAQAPLIYNSSNVSKPSPRYATATDSWPSRLLGERLKASE